MELLEMHGITKRFDANIANDSIDFTVRKGEIHAILGENGAGKTTLMNILYGLYRQDDGEIYLDGRPIQMNDPRDAIAHGVGMVHQHFMLVQKMTLLQNIVLGLKPAGYPLFKKKALLDSMNALAERYGLRMELDTPVSALSVGVQQRGEIMKALYRKARLLILDEPTAVLTPQEIQDLFSIMRMLKEEGHSIILISHKLKEIMDISDRVTILREGRVVRTVETAQTNEVELSDYMIGHVISDAPYEKESLSNGAESILKVENVCLARKGSDDKAVLDSISFDVRFGEVLGVAGVDGNGQKELAEVLTGICGMTSGKIDFDGENISAASIRKRFERGMAYISDDRHKDGLVMDADVESNMLLRSYYKPPISKRGVLNKKEESVVSQRQVAAYHIKTTGVKQKVRLLSGGNQQKVVLARELMSEPKFVLACQPTRGLDIGATEQMRKLLMDCRNSGRSVLLISTDLDEILRMSDRILVMHEGKIMGVIPNKDVKRTTIGRMMGGQRLEEITSEN